MAQTQPSPPDTNQNGPVTNQDSKAAPPRNLAAAKPGTEENAGIDPVALLTADHRRVEQLFGAFEKATNNQQKSRIAKEICTELVIHTLIEEEIFYPACQGHVERRLLEEAQVEHDGTKALIIEIQAGSPDDQYYDAKVKVLSEDVKHHIREEEKPGEGILPKAKEAGIATAELANELATRKQKLTEEAKAEALGPPQTRSFRARTEAGANQAAKELSMARGSSSTMERERDERGRFVSDDDDDRDYRRHSSSRSRYDDDNDDRRSSRSRDEDGRFTSSRSRSRDDDDDDRRGGGRDHGQGGWFGDSGGHSRASREGWEERGGSRSRSRDDDDDRRSSRSRDDEGRFTSTRSRSRDDDDDDRRGSSRDHGQGGWFGDSEGHSRASREGWDERGGTRSRSRDDDDDRRSSRSRDDEGRFTSTRSRSRDDDDDRRGGSRDHGQGGWFGDSEGHSRASREGWDERGGSRSRDDDDDRRSSRSRDDEGRFTSTRSRDDDDDDRRGGSRSRGHGGWYGDSEGHAEAARQRRR